MKTLFLLIASAFTALTSISQVEQTINFSASSASLSDFESIPKGNSVQLFWTASNETNVSSYEIQKSTNGSAFNNIGTITALNNANTSRYSFLDATPTEGENYYRLRSVDKRGVVAYSDILRVNTGFGRTGINVLSNPVQGGILNLQLNNINSGKYAISLYSNSGQKVFARSLDLTAGSSNETINLPQNIGKGMYFLQVTDGTMRMNKQVILQ